MLLKNKKERIENYTFMVGCHGIAVMASANDGVKSPDYNTQWSQFFFQEKKRRN